MDRRFAFFSIVVLLAAGCRQSPYVSSHLEILGAERRALEDRVLDLEFELERAEKKLDAYQDEGGSGSTTGNSRSTNRTQRDSAADDGGNVSSPSITIPGLGDEPTLEPPRVNEGRPADGELPIPNGDAAMASPRYQKPTRPVAVRSRVPGDPRITHVALNPTLTGGADFDRKSGDDGLIVVLQPRNAENEFVPLAGPIAVVLLDYAKRDQGSAALVARWDIDATNVHKAMVRNDDARGIHLRLPWPDQTPEHSKLRMDVRYTTPDGRHLDVRADVYITLPGQFSTRWTPRAPRSESQDTLPHDGQPPVNIAQQPDENESALQTRTPQVIQSAFTAVPRPAEIVADKSSGAEGDNHRNGQKNARPTWQPNR